MQANNGNLPNSTVPRPSNGNPSNATACRPNNGHLLNSTALGPSNGNPPNATASRPSNTVDDIEQCTYISCIIMTVRLQEDVQLMVDHLW